MPHTRPLENILFVAIQTVPQAAQLKDLNPRLQQAWRQKAVQLEAEEDSPEALYASQAGLYAEFGKIINISVGYFHRPEPEGDLELRVKAMNDAEDERKVLEEFIKLLQDRFDQNSLRLCAHNGKEFDFPYLCRRMLVHCVPIPPVLSFAGKKPWEVPHLDTMEMWMFGNRKYLVGLETLAAIFDIPTNESQLRGSEVKDVFYEEKDLQQIISRGQQDVITTAQVFMRYRCSPLLSDKQIVLV
ncbi:ribonuclease H-like domain-containing protein [Nafulsella turpanensis]|uniref:ribonuclease H-like domain-containing protein n=1 Tax=Nafulsella turpanensis TaxID=1265690 RepID=UPI00034CA013|nr:ribonuclease H-like domain-containing protein [Nafulsella turpanensis]